MKEQLIFAIAKFVILYLAKKLVKNTKTDFDDKLYEEIEKVLNNAA